MSDNEPQAPSADPEAARQAAASLNRRRRLLFRANHRGTHECDLLIGGYVARRIDSLSEAEMDALEEVMELDDSELADWLTGRLPIPPHADSPMLRAMRAAAEAGEGRT